MLAAIIYGLSTPVDIAVGLALRSSYNPGSATAPIVSVFDLLSADILIYTGLVEVRFFLNVVASIKLTGNTASRARVPVQQGNGEQLERQTCVRHWGDAPGLRVDGSPWQMGIGIACVVG
jgi:hypothetical protein